MIANSRELEKTCLPVSYFGLILPKLLLKRHNYTVCSEKKGVTIRKPNDCLIAYYGLFHSVPILHNDSDFVQIARYTALEMVSAEE